jgi:TIR domain
MAASLPPAPGRVFISYRREETAYPAGWLYDRLTDRFADGQVFKDIDSIELGDDFVEVISTAVGSCDVLLALIGDRWLTITDEDGQRRLDDPNDFVRVEIEAALARNVRVIPILVEGARMPRAAELPPSLARLVRRQALELSPARFDSDTSRLLRVLERTLAEVRTAQQDAASTKAPVEEAPDSSTTKLPEAPEEREPAERTPTPTTPPALATPAATQAPSDQRKPPDPSATEPLEGPERPARAAPSPPASVPPAAPATPAATRPPTDQTKPPEPSTTEVQEAPQQPEPATSPTPSIPLAAPATPAATRPPPDQTKPPGTQRRRLSARQRILAGAGVGVVLILVIVTIVANSQTNESVLFRDDFSSQANGWEDTGSERAGGHFNNGAYRVLAEPDSDGDGRGAQPKNANSVYPSAPPNLIIEVEAQRTAGGQDTWYGITCRAAANSGNPAYEFEIGNGRVNIGKVDASGYQLLKGVDTSTVDAGAKNSLSANCDGDKEQTYVYLALWVNGEKVAEVTDKNPLPAGTVGLFVFAGPNADAAVEAEFDNLVVKQV